MSKQNKKHIKKRVLFIIQLPPPVHGASMMNKFVVDSSVIRNEYDIKVLPLKFVNRIDEIGTLSWKKAWASVVFIYHLVKTLIKFKPNLVYYTIAPVGNAFLRDAFFVKIIKLFNRNILFHLHGKGIRNSIQAKPWTATLYKQTFKNTSVIHLSESLLYDLDLFISSISNVFVIPNGIPEISEEKIIIKKDEPSKVQIIYLSNLDSTKGVLVLIEALKLLHIQQIDFDAKIIGNSADVSIDELKELVQELNLNDKIKVLGPIYNQEKYQQLHDADIFVFPTNYKNECFPLSILEAMQMSNAIISTDNGAIKEIIEVGVNGFIVAPKDPLALSTKIKELIDNKDLLEKMKENNRKKYKDQYTLQSFESALLNSIEKVTNGTQQVK